jgi:hypothetical protein
MTTGYFISLGFTILWCGALLLYWRWRLDRQSRAWKAQREREMAEDHARFEAQRARWDAEDAKARAEHAAVMAEAEAVFERANQFWIKRGMEPTKPPETSEPSQ